MKTIRTGLLLAIIAMLLLWGACALAETKSGTCGAQGDNLTWTLDDAGTLTIHGTGKMENYGWRYYPEDDIDDIIPTPWELWGTDIKAVEIGHGVTSIGNEAFSNCRHLSTITIPDGVTSIGNLAFFDCSNLSSITIPDSVTSIGYGAFSRCSSLSTITIPDGVTSIANYTFANCSSLGMIAIPEGVTSIDYQAFYNCTTLLRISLLDGVTSMGSNVFTNCPATLYANIDSAGAKLLSKSGYAFRAPGSNYNLKYLFSGDEMIGLEASRCDARATEAVIPGEVTRIANSTFANCENLSKLCIYSMTTNFGVEIINWDCVPTVYCYEFSDAEGWAMDNGYPVVLLDGMNIDSYRTVSLPETLLVALGETKPLEATVFPDEKPEIAWSLSDSSVASIADGAITGLKPGTTTVTATVGTVSADMTVVVYILAQSYELNVTEAWVAAKQPVQLSAVGIQPEGAEVSLTWKSSNTSLATVNENGLVTTKKPGDVTITARSDNGIVRSCLLHLCYPVTAIAFEPASVSVAKGSNVTLTAKVTSRDGKTYVNKLVTFSSDNEAVATVDTNGVVTARSMGTATITATSTNGVSAACVVTVPEPHILILPTNLTTIENEAFMNDTTIESVIVPDGCRYIGARAFAGCTNLIYIEMSANCAVAGNAFDGCDNVTIDRRG